MKRTILAAAAWLLAWPVVAADKNDAGGFHAYKAGEAVEVAHDKGYVLARIDTSKLKVSYLLMRVPSEAELTAFEEAKMAAYDKLKKKPPYDTFSFAYDGTPNLFEIRPQKSFGSEGQVAVTLAELPPGEYVLYGQGFNGYLWECMCLGTVEFAVDPGKVTDIGTLVVDNAWDKSTIPELAGVTGLGRIARMDYGLFAIGLRPPVPEKPVAGLDPALLASARFKAVGPFVETNTLLVTRLAPIAGVLRYDGGRVIDVTSGEEALPH